jgi:glycosyltransferase involved in cell wall biosynthesis
MLRKEQSTNPNGYFKAVIPHKMLSDMASGRPLLLSAEVYSDAADLMRIANCGLSVPPEDPAALAEAILKMKHARKQRELWAKNGYEFARSQFDYQGRSKEWRRCSSMLRLVAHTNSMIRGTLN